MAETGPVPDTRECYDCRAAVIWLWSPRVSKRRGGWVMFTRSPDDPMTITSHRCHPPRGEFSYQGGESQP